MTTTYLQTKEGTVFTTSSPEYHPDCNKLTIANGKALLSADATQTLRELLQPGQTIFCTLRSVSSSGMSRRISFHSIVGDELRSLDYLMSHALRYKQSSSGGLVVSGCGMDMAFSVVYNLGAVLWPNGTPKPHGRRNGADDDAGGYALKHKWV